MRHRHRSLHVRIVSNLILFVAFIGMGALGYVLGLRAGRSRPGHRPAVAKSTPAIVTPAPEPLQDTSAEGNLLAGGTTDVPIIMYHDVVPNREVWFDLTTSEFADQMDALAAAGANPITMQDLYDHLKTGKPLPDHPIVLTFDDCTLGHYTYVLPILKQHHFSAVFFVQTASVGVKTEKEHMTWQQLNQAEDTGLVRVESHTVTHPEDITKLSDSDLDHEMQASKQAIEAHLGHPVMFLAYPSGNCDARVAQAVERAGYLAAVTMDRGWAASPAQSLFLPRLTPKRLQEVIDAWKGSGEVDPPSPRLIKVKDAPLEQGTFDAGSCTVQWIAGGDLGSQALDTRETVGEMALAVNAQAALNGTFFSDARVASTGSAMIGPVLCRTDHNYKPAEASEEPRLEGRPFVMVGEGKCLVVPYFSHLGHSLEVLQQIMPDVKDAFLSGGWIVHAGKAVSDSTMHLFSTGDAEDPRHRAFVGVDKEGRYILGATQDSVGTSALARALEKMGVQEAWLMDSGFSTSLIWQNHVLVTGHYHKEVPSRPVPHALFLFGQPAPDAPPPPADSAVAAGPGAATTAEALAADGGGGTVPTTHHRRRRHKGRQATTL